MNQAPENHRRFWRWSLWISTAVLAVALVLLLVHFWPLLSSHRVPEESSQPQPTETTTTEKLEDNPIDFASLQAQYPDVVGWIRNTVLYGHYMANGMMFADLHKFRKADFFQQHDTLYIYTPGHILTYRIYAAFVYDNRHILNSFDFSNPFEYQAFLSQTLNPSSMRRQVRDGVTVTTDDRIITLSTCTGKSTERYLVEGVLIHDQRTK